jgi:tetratricopeptide (TPR) repeat protein
MTRFDEAWQEGQEALAIAREVGDRLHEAWVLTTTLPVCLIRSGEFAAARSLLEEGLEIATRIGSLVPQAYGNWCLAEMHRWQGQYEPALVYGQRALQAALPLEDFQPFVAVQPLGTLGSIYLEISPKFHDAVTTYHQHALRLLEHPAGMMGGGTAWADLGWCAMSLGDEEIAGDSFQKGLHHPSMFMRLERPRHLAGAALLASRQGRPGEALSLAQEACAYAEERGMRHLYPLMRLALGRVQAASGYHEEALAQIAICAEHAVELGMRPILWQAHAAAAHSLEALGQPDEAAAQRTAALATIDEIAGLFQDPTLSTAFREAATARLDDAS